MSTNDCDSIYSSFKGRPVAAAAAEGALIGLAGMIGLGGFWHPTDDTVLKNATSKLSDLKAEWHQVLGNKEQVLIDEQRNFAQEQLDLYEVSQQFKNEIMDEQIATNTLLIQILFGIVLIVIIYLAVL